jgi:hypothetical protein
LRTADAASFPSCTSCFGVYFFFGSLITVCGRQARCKFLQDGGRNLPIASLAPERHIGIDRRGAAGGQVAGEKRGAD